MPGESKNGMQCAEFDALLSDALDELLTGQELESFRAHARVCQLCGPLWAEAQEGKRWLKGIAEVEPPSSLLHNILAATSGIDSFRLRTPAAAPKVSLADRIRGWADSFVAPAWGIARQPRFVMSFGMAFFTLSVAMSISGVKLADLRRVDLRPSAIRRTYYETSGRVVKFYENIRVVYEFESRVRELKRATTPAEPAPQPEQRDRRNNNTSGQPEQKQERNYSQGESDAVLASLPDNPPVVSVTTTHRRFV